MRTPTWDRAVFDAKQLCAAVRRRECHLYQFADGFDTYSTPSTLYESTGGTLSISSVYARFAPPVGLPGQGIKFVSGGSFIRKNLQSNQTTIIIKVAINFASLGSHSINPFLGALDAGTYQWTLCVSPSGALLLLQGNTGATQASTGPGIFSAGAYYGIECEVSVGTGTAFVNVWVNGVSVLTGTGLTTRETANFYANQVGIGDLNTNGLAGMTADDFRVWDNSGSTQNVPLGTDSRILSKLPDGAGAYTQFAANGAAANWQCVDDNPPDGDTTYVSGAASGLQDAYAMPSAGMTAAPVMVVARSYVRKDDAATRSLEIGVVSSGSIGVGASITLGSAYQFIDSCIALDPHTSAAWTAAAADAAEHYKLETA